MPATRDSVNSHLWARQASRRQAGVLSKKQLISLGWTLDQIRAQTDAMRWVTLYPGIYRTVTGEATREGELWAALLACGDGAALSHETAAEVWGFGPVSDLVHVLVPAERRVAPRPGIAVVRSRYAAARTDPRAVAPRTRMDDTVVDLVESCVGELDAVGWITRAVQRRRTTAKRVHAAALLRAGLHHRALIDATCAQVAEGAHSPLKVGWVQRVERPHGLPRPTRAGLP